MLYCKSIAGNASLASYSNDDNDDNNDDNDNNDNNGNGKIIRSLHTKAINWFEVTNK